MNPLYQALICCFVKLVLSMRKVMSSFDSFLLDFPPMMRRPCRRADACGEAVQSDGDMLLQAGCWDEG